MKKQNLSKIETKRLILRKPKKEDIEEVYNLINEKSIFKNFFTPYPYKKKHTTDFVNYWIKGWGKKSYWIVLELKETGEIVGVAGIREIDKTNKTAQVHSWIGKKYRLKMKHILKEGKISLLLPEGEGGALSGEVHLIQYDNKKYIVRRCEEISQAKFYESISKKFEKYGFLPKFLGRFGKDVLYEYIEGRDLTKEESLSTIEQMGRIAGYINRVKIQGKVESRFNKQLRELSTGNYVLNIKERTRVNKNKNKGKRAVLKKDQIEKIKKIYNLLKKKVNPTLALDVNDVSPNNFRIDKKGKVYLVDIEGIKPRIKGFGFAKFYLKFGKTTRRINAYKKGYNSVISGEYLTEEYLDFININFFVQKILYNIKIFDKDYKNTLDSLNKILIKYLDK